MRPGLHSSRFPNRVFSAAAAIFVLFAQLSLVNAANAQEKKAAVAPPGDQLATPGPLAQILSPRLDRDDLSNAMMLVADWQLTRLPAQAQVDWTWAALYDGFMAVPDQVAGNKYKAAMLKVANDLNWQPGPRVMHADDLAVGQMFLEQYTIHKDSKMMAAMRARLDAEMATPDPTDPQKPLWWWCDALFMAPPVWSGMYAATGDRKYIDYLDEEWAKTSDRLYDPKEHLYFRDSTYLTKTEPNGKKMFWSRGNGWVMGGIIRTLRYLPKDDPARAKYIAQLKEMAARVAEIQGPDGLWKAGLLDPGDYDLPEISGSAFFTYALAAGVNEGILDRKTYRPVIEKAWAGMLHHIYADGRLGCIQQTGADPEPFKASASYNYGVGAFLLAGSEIRKMHRPSAGK